ncbi:MAG: carbonic anhydrase [Bacteroidaceae bacterium]|nr:carbonic anhydrase [Bacteroidaceae bacterium]
MNIKRQLLYIVARLAWPLSDSVMLKLQYRIRTGRKLHLDNPQRFSEKVQHYKAYYRNPEMTQCVDKYDVREYVARKLGNETYLNTLYQVCDTAKDIDFDALPKEFIIKTTDGGNGDNVLICRDKDKLDTNQAVQLVNSWRNKRYYVISREWAYEGAKQSKVIVEELLVDPDSNDGSICDYKFLCYKGKFKYLWVDKDRYSNHRRGFWNHDLQFMPDKVSDHPTFSKEEVPALPDNVQEMIAVSEKLAEGFPFVRIDLYNIRGRIIFGEMTFYPWSGYCRYTPDSFDFDLGLSFDVNAYGKFDKRLKHTV